jgi:hypothetical protein
MRRRITAVTVACVAVAVIAGIALFLTLRSSGSELTRGRHAILADAKAGNTLAAEDDTQLYIATVRRSNLDEVSRKAELSETLLLLQAQSMKLADNGLCLPCEHALEEASK